MDDSVMVSMADLLKKRMESPVPQKKRITERGEFLKEFSAHLNMNIPRVALLLTGVPTKDFYYIQKKCDEEKSRGKKWSDAFYNLLAPHES
jgi:hypothetical protein